MNWYFYRHHDMYSGTLIDLSTPQTIRIAMKTSSNCCLSRSISTISFGRVLVKKRASKDLLVY